MALEREEPRPTPAALNKPRLGVVIGSGSIKCVSALGFLRVLRRERIPVDLVVGCSAGGIYASGLALGWDLDELERKSYETWQGLFARLDYRGLIQGLLPRLFRRVRGTNKSGQERRT